MSGISSIEVVSNSTWGPEDPEVNSIWMLLKETIDKLHDETAKDEADFWADRVYEKLNEARNHYKEIRSENFGQRPSSERDGIYNAYYACLWAAYKDRFVKLLKAIGYESGAFFAGDAQYESQMQGFALRYHELSWVKQLMDNQKANWQDVLRDNRNAYGHDGDLRNNLDLPNINNPVDAWKMVAYVCRAIEALGMCLLSYKLPDIWEVVEIDREATVFDRRPRFKVQVTYKIRPKESDEAS